MFMFELEDSWSSVLMSPSHSRISYPALQRWSRGDTREAQTLLRTLCQPLVDLELKRRRDGDIVSETAPAPPSCSTSSILEMTNPERSDETIWPCLHRCGTFQFELLSWLKADDRDWVLFAPSPIAGTAQQCCGERHCHPVPCGELIGAMNISTDGPDRIRVDALQTSPDGARHACVDPFKPKPDRLLCLFAPKNTS